MVSEIFVKKGKKKGYFLKKKLNLLASKSFHQKSNATGFLHFDKVFKKKTSFFVFHKNWLFLEWFLKFYENTPNLGLFLISKEYKKV
jgi:hypothetical protein